MTRRRKILLSIAAVPVVLVALAVVGLVLFCWTHAVPAYGGQASDHFDGERFENLIERRHATLGEAARALVDGDAGPWPSRANAPAGHDGPPPPSRVGPGELQVTFINHATLLVQIDGVNVLTDPIWSERASPVSWAGPQRVRPPGLPFDRLPPIDVVLVSHNHYDHMDLPTLRRLAAVHHPRMLVPLGNRAFLEREGIPGAEDLDWWMSRDVGSGVRVTAVPAQHFSGRALCDGHRALWAGFVLAGRSGPVYFAGDTASGPHFAQIRERFGPMRVALLPIGGYRPPAVMARVHVSPEEALEAHQILGAQNSIGIHFGTFRLSADGESEPVEQLRAVLKRAPAGTPPFEVLAFGETRRIAGP